jgi:nitrogen regulatory protein P-II 1
MPAIGLAKTTRFKSGISNPNTVDFLPEILLLAVVADDLAEAAVQAIIKATKTASAGGGKIFVSAIERAIRIRTEEVGEKAI